MPNLEWKGMCVLLNSTRRNKIYENGVEIGAIEIVIFVQWYEKKDLNSNELNYWVLRTINKPQV